METIAKTPVEALQELIAIHTTRKEAVEQLIPRQTDQDIVAQLKAVAVQSDEYIKGLMNELSNYGDGVLADVDRTNDYQQIWKSVLPELDTLGNQKVQQAFLSMESRLKRFYLDALKMSNELPASLSELLNRQFSQL